ncbi:hypothetical protein ACVGXO_00260, partial [Enterobacter hormaechei]
LRTPLTRLQLGTALLGPRTGESKHLDPIDTQAQRHHSMIKHHKVFSRQHHKKPLERQTEKPKNIIQYHIHITLIHNTHPNTHHA